jgi:ketosteroid isomerase-like protein
MKSRPGWLLCCLLMLAVPARAQEHAPDRADLVAEIDRQLWQPFVNGVNDNQPALYNGTHADDFHWVAAGSGTRIMDAAVYSEDSRKVMDERAAKGIRSRMEVRFLERHIDGAFAAERAVVRFTTIAPGKPDDVSYGTMHVFSRKRDGSWKKIIQYVEGPATAETFERAAPM